MHKLSTDDDDDSEPDVGPNGQTRLECEPDVYVAGSTSPEQNVIITCMRCAPQHDIADASIASPELNSHDVTGDSARWWLRFFFGAACFHSCSTSLL